MAGLYPDVPGHRMAYDRDGTYVTYAFSNGTFDTAWDTAKKERANDGSTSTTAHTASWWHCIFIFPQLRDVVAIYMNVSHGNGRPVAWEWSTDTTNGLDGTWTAFTGPTGSNVPVGGVRDQFRTAIFAVSGVTAVKSIRCRRDNTANYSIYDLQLYGHVSTPTGLEVWHPTLDERLGGAGMDWGDQEQEGSTVPEFDFRVKNHHGSDTRTSITLSVEALSDSTPAANAPLHELSDDGSTWAATLVIADIGPGAISPVYTVRREPGGVLGPWDARIVSEST